MSKIHLLIAKKKKKVEKSQRESLTSQREKIKIGELFLNGFWGFLLPSCKTKTKIRKIVRFLYEHFSR
jgi:hypothetical protein